MKHRITDTFYYMEYERARYNFVIAPASSSVPIQANVGQVRVLVVAFAISIYVDILTKAAISLCIQSYEPRLQRTRAS